MNGHNGVLNSRYFGCCRQLQTAIANLRSVTRAITAVRLSAALVFGLLSLPVHAQVAGGLVGGTTRDSAGNAVPEVRIVAHDLDRGTDLFTATDTNGMYKFT